MTGLARGRFLTLEGGEGVGKSTQLKAVAGRLRDRGLIVVETREPGGSAGAEAIRALLLNGRTDAWSPISEALLFAAARADHVERVIEPALARGEWVICDRFVDSTRAYQGGSVSDADIIELHRIGSAGLMPDRTFLLHAADTVAQERRAARDTGRDDRFERRGDDFHAGVVAAFRHFAAAEPDRFRAIDASGSPAEVSDRIFAALEDLL